MARYKKPINKNFINYQINYKISFPFLRVIDIDGKQLGVISKNEGIKRAKISGLDLVLINTKAKPPIAKIVNFAKFKYEQNKQEKNKQKLQRASIIKIKEVRMGVGIQEHDIKIKGKKILQFLEKGFKVKISIKFIGREQMYKEQAKEIIEKLIDYCNDIINIEFDKKIDYSGKNVWCILRKE